ncbi:glycosyltransferase involved in cell wall biosynthesis [Hymenobacter luteus]|uniref:Glycosyltransferase involved in cell wall biosynthesis n=2 Tax=Hymenobacter TaxID=89966 RepID=A0A7W9WBM9_9BACT|nr:MULTISPECIES: glycosyltransferase family 1 protein [Hymenobacter]MBB4601198.1 glycosyltransferase involved in cell wall biosynthesis [Hymenobacter latericoloratus]MBB6058595.1 glycosyltransferase involved in cell wall biosynthesis [Hymenobacter luteus]
MEIAVNVRFLLPGDKLEGIGRFTLETLRCLVQQHPEHTFHFLFDRAFDERYRLGPNVVPHVLAPPARHPLLWVAWFEGAVARWLRRHRPAVFLSPDGYTTLRTHVPRVTVIHDLAFEHFPEDVNRLVLKYYRYFTPRFARASRRVVAVSEATRQDLMQTYGVAPEKISVVYNAADRHFRPQPAAVQLATRERFSAGKAYFLFVGALQPRKNLVNLLRAFDAFKTSTGAPVKLLVVGRTAWKAGPIFEVYQQMRHRSDVHLTGRVTDAELVELYAAALATCYVPYFEGFGIPVIEAQACACPVITSSCSSLPEVAGGAARLVDPFSVASIAEGLGEVYASESYRAELTERGLRNVERFSWEESARRLWLEIEACVA